MTWNDIGWAIVGLGAVLLAVFKLILNNDHKHPLRGKTAIKALRKAQVRALEQGKKRQVIIGEHLWSRAYPGLGLHALSTLPEVVSLESLMEGKQAISAGGDLAVLARQVIQGHYQNGYSYGLLHSPVGVLGVGSFSFAAGLLPELLKDSPGSMTILGDHGFEAGLLANAVQTKGGHVFSATGSLTAQAALYLTVRDLLIGEEIFLLPGLIKPTPGSQAGWTVEDILRIVLIVLLILISILKASGIV